METLKRTKNELIGWNPNEEGRKIPKIVAYLSSSAGRRHFACTEIVGYLASKLLSLVHVLRLDQNNI